MLQTFKQFGRSVFLTEFQQQKQGLGSETNLPVFLSLHISEEFSPGFCAAAQNACNWLYAKGHRILADVSPKTLRAFGQTDLAVLAQQQHLWALRIDYGFSVQQTADLARRYPVVLNASTVSVQDARIIAAAGQPVFAMHNFYPRPETGLDDELLRQTTCRLQAQGIQVIAFVAGDEQLRGPVYAGLPTLERHRHLAPSAAAVDLLQSFGMDGVYIGDPGLSPVQQQRIQRYLSTGCIELPVQLRREYHALYGRPFTNRADSPRWMIRYAESREYSCRGAGQAPQNCLPRRRGCITMDNERYGRYAGEIQLLRKDFPADERVNVIGWVDSAHLLLADCIQNGGRFVMVPGEQG